MTDQATRKCPFCSELIQLDAKKCRFCNEWLTELENANSHSGKHVGIDATFADNHVRPAIADSPEHSSISQEQQRRFFVGEKYNTYYKEAFAKVEMGTRSFNWAACVWGVSWLLYRKQYARAMSLFVLLLLAEAAVYALMRLEPVADAFDTVNVERVTTALWYGLGGYLGVQGNKLYLKHVTDKISAVTLSFSGSASRIALSDAGGVSLWKSAGVLGILVALAVSLSEAPSALLGTFGESHAAAQSEGSEKGSSEPAGSTMPNSLTSPNRTARAESEGSRALTTQHFGRIVLLRDAVSFQYDKFEWLRVLGSDPSIVQFQRKAGDAYAQIITEPLELTDDALRFAAIQNLQKVDPNAEMLFEEKRSVGGRDMWVRNMRASVNGVTFVYLNCYYTGPEGSIQVMTWTTPNLFEDMKTDMEAFFDGIAFPG